MNEKEIRKIAREEAMKVQTQNFLSGAPEIPPHRHDGVDNIRINQSSVLAKPVFNGSIEMDYTGIYTIPVTTNPTSVTFYGVITNPSTNTTVGFHSMIIGTANFGKCYQFQPGTSRSVTLGTVRNNIIQGCSSFNYQIFNPINTTALVSQGHIVYANFVDPTGKILIFADVVSFNNSQIQISVNIPANSGYVITGLWIVN